MNSTATTVPVNAAAFEADAPATSLHRFTPNGDAKLEQHLARVCDEVGKGVRSIVPALLLEGILLGGGYGRGEGGVLETATGDAPYNDMEFYVFIRGSTLLNDRLYKKALHHFGESLSEMAGLEVEFKILSLSGLRRSPVNMFSYDFVVGHRWVIGSDRLLEGCEHHRVASDIPQHEATRLLFNRCTGLLYARERLMRETFTSDDADFVARNIAKAQLALGDALLTSSGRYHWSCQERHRRLGSDLPLVKETHAKGVTFKLHPQRTTLSREQLVEAHRKTCELASSLWISLESSRLGHSFKDLAHYRNSEVDKCPEQPAWRNRLVNARLSGLVAYFSPASLRYPRERLFHTLTLLLWEDISKPAVLMEARKHLQSAESSFTSLVQAYHTLWSRFN